MPVACKRCGRELGEDEGKRVADWRFCEACFQQLLADAAERAAAPPTAPASVAPPPTSGTATAPSAPAAPTSAVPICRGCKRELPEGEVRSLLGLTFCPACEAVFRQGLSSPVIDLVAASPEEAQPEAPRREQVPTDVAAAVRCHRCQRQIKVLGSREHEGERYCPDCYRQVAAATPAPPVECPRPAPARAGRVTVTAAAGAAPACMSCGQTGRGPLEPIDGFPICAACRGTDPALAVEIARARHRRLLETLKQQLD
jgi:hypothetical protein